VALTEDFIRTCADDEALYQALSAELQQRVPGEIAWDRDGHVARMRACPVGLRAMAAVHPLDLSMAFSDLGYHFVNWHYRPHCEETLLGLRELEIPEAAEIFEQACAVVQPHWDTIGDLHDEFEDWYETSDLRKALGPLNERLWSLCRRMPIGLLSSWVPYARKYPGRVLDSPQT
jgi:hypothetical protein